MKKNKVSCIKTGFSLLLLATLMFTLMVPFQTKVQAEKVEHSDVISQTIETQRGSQAKNERLVRADYGQMALTFEENRGQTEAPAKFISRGAGYMLYLAQDEAVFTLRLSHREAAVRPETAQTTGHRPQTSSDILRMQFVGANAAPKIEGTEKSLTKTNYYAGNKKFKNLSNFQQVRYTNLYEGIDALFYGKQSELEYDFIVSPQADARKIQLNFDGAEKISIDHKGNLTVKTANTEIVQHKPFAYQETGGIRQEVACQFKLTEIRDPQSATRKQLVGFELGAYDQSKPLVIDPVLTYSTFIGGSGFDSLNDIEVDTDGNAYIAGTTFSTDFPTTASRVEADYLGAFVAQINADGSAFKYITILEGDGDDFGHALALDSDNNAYVTGATASADFPTTPGAFQEEHPSNALLETCPSQEILTVTGLIRSRPSMTAHGRFVISTN